MHFAFYFMAAAALFLLIAFMRTFYQLERALEVAEYLRSEVELNQQISAELDAENAQMGHQLRKFTKQHDRCEVV